MNNNKAHELFKYLVHKNNNSSETDCQYLKELPSKNSKNFTRAPKPQNQKKIIKPLSNNKLSATKRQSNTNITRKTISSKNTGNQTTVSRLKNVTRDNLIIKIQQLENENVEIQNKYQKLLTENRILKTMEKRQEHALLFYEGTESKLPQIMKSLNDDIQVYKGRIKQMQSTYKELENRYRSQSTELSMMTKKHNHLLNLSKNKNLNEREKLQDQLKDAQNTISHQEKKIENLMKNLELQCKSYQHHIILEKNKNKELQKELIKMKSMNDNINLKNNNFQNNTARLFLKNHTVRHSISHSPCAVKTMTNNDLTDKEDNKSLYKINAKSLNENCNGNNRNHMNDSTTRTQNKNPILFNKENIEHLHNDIKYKTERNPNLNVQEVNNKLKINSAKQSFSRGINENSITLTQRITKPESANYRFNNNNETKSLNKQNSSKSEFSLKSSDSSDEFFITDNDKTYNEKNIDKQYVDNPLSKNRESKSFVNQNNNTLVKNNEKKLLHIQTSLMKSNSTSTSKDLLLPKFNTCEDEENDIYTSKSKIIVNKNSQNVKKFNDDDDDSSSVSSISSITTSDDSNE